MSLPLVAIVGRPNVGKSTFFNRIASTSQAITHEKPGVTRDRNYTETDWSGQRFILIDTGGLDLDVEGNLSLSEAVTEQVLLAIAEADAIIFLVDGKEGLLPGDYEVASLLRRSQKPAILAVNKIDDFSKDMDKYSFYNLGLGEVYPVSALHGLGTGELLDALVALLPSKKEQDVAEMLNVAIVGRPNVGKSSILNRLVGDQRAVVSESPGTTRDAVDTIVNYKNLTYCFVDTAGIKKRKQRTEAVEYYSFVRSLKALDRADISLVIIDASTSVVGQDQKIAELALKRGCACILILNKWDLVVKERQAFLQKGLSYRFRFLSFAPVLAISALTGQGIKEIYSVLAAVASEYEKRIQTSELNVFVQKLLQTGNFPSEKRRRLKILYATQVGSRPPRFIFFVNHPEIIKNSFRRYVENQLRQSFGFEGCPLKIYFRRRK